jgi:hypothetical protein
MARVFAILFFAVAMCAASAQTSEHVPKLRSFEALGCSGDWPPPSSKPQVWRVVAPRAVTFLVRHPAACGLSGGRAKVAWKSGVLDLDYKMDPLAKDVVIMCDCEYWARFTFDSSALKLKKVTVAGQPAELSGAWPK